MKKDLHLFALVLLVAACSPVSDKNQLASLDDPSSADSLLAMVAKAEDPVISIPATPAVQQKGDYIAAKTAGILAYQWGYALVRMERTMRDYIDVPEPKPATSYRAPLNEIGWATRLPTATDKDMPTSNNDTYYMSAVVNLTEPYLLKVPDTKDRYYVVDVFDMYQNLVDYIGRRTTSTKAGTFAIVPPGWKGKLPAGVTKIVECPTPKAWLWGRIAVKEDDDIAVIHALQNQFQLTSLSGKRSTATLAEMPKFPASDSLRFFKELAFAMSQNPIELKDSGLVGQFEQIGLTPGKFDPSALNADQLNGLKDAVLEGPLSIIASVQANATQVNGWSWVTKLDNFGYDYALRSMISGPYLGGQGEKEALYPIRYTDSKGESLSGNNSYKIHFEKEPPVDAFWSLTLYDANTKLFYDNEMNRYKLSTESKALKRNADGSFDIIVQHAKPADTDNWLPAPDGLFYLILRMYQPSEEVLSKQYKMPEVEKVN